MKPPQRPGAPRPSQARARLTPKSGVERPTSRAAPRVERPSAASSMSWRAVVLTGVMALALAVMVPSFRAFLKQQETIEDLKGQVAGAHADVDDLEGEVARWDDPAYVIAQARDRLLYVLPGETPYRVVDPEYVADPGVARRVNPDAPAEPIRPWFATLWGSIEAADSRP